MALYDLPNLRMDSNYTNVYFENTAANQSPFPSVVHIAINVQTMGDGVSSHAAVVSTLAFDFDTNREVSELNIPWSMWGPLHSRWLRLMFENEYQLYGQRLVFMKR